MGTVIRVQPSCEFYFERAMKAFGQAQYPRAIHAFKLAQSLARTPKAAVFVSCQLSICYETMGRFQAAVNVLQQFSAPQRRKFPEIHYFLATAFAFLNDYQQSNQELELYLASGDQNFQAEANALLEQLTSFTN